MDQDVNLVRAVRVADPQVRPQMIKDGVSRVRVGVLPRRPLVNQARAAVVRVNQERVAVLPQAHLVRLMDGVGGQVALAHHPAVNLARVIQEGESASSS